MSESILLALDFIVRVCMCVVCTYYRNFLFEVIQILSTLLLG